nr:hypothetical protein [Tanacetum cinerariifolium]
MKTKRKLVPTCVATGGSKSVSDIGGSDMSETVSVVSGGTYAVGDDECSIRELDCGPGSSVNMPELPGHSGVEDSGISSMRSTAESASNVVTNPCLGDRILDTGCTDTVSTSPEANPDIGSSSFSRETGSIGIRRMMIKKSASYHLISDIRSVTDMVSVFAEVVLAAVVVKGEDAPLECAGNQFYGF